MTTLSSRLISREITSISGSESSSFDFSTSRCSAMAFRGFLISWATPLVSRLMAASREETSNCDRSCFRVSASRSVTSVPMAFRLESVNDSRFSSKRVWVPSGRLIVTTWLLTRVPACRASWMCAPIADSSGNTSSICLPSNWPRLLSSRRSACSPAAISLPSPSKSRTASSRRCSKCSILDRSCEASCCAPRNCCPSRLSFDCTAANSRVSRGGAGAGG